MKNFDLQFKFAAFFIIFLVSMIATVKPFADQSKNFNSENIKFIWAFGAARQISQKAQIEPITRDTSLLSGDRIKFFIKLESNCRSKNVQLPCFCARKNIPETKENSVLGIYPFNFNRICFELKMESEVKKNITCLDKLDKQNPIENCLL